MGSFPEDAAESMDLYSGNFVVIDFTDYQGSDGVPGGRLEKAGAGDSKPPQCMDYGGWGRKPSDL